MKTFPCSDVGGFMKCGDEVGRMKAMNEPDVIHCVCDGVSYKIYYKGEENLLPANIKAMLDAQKLEQPLGVYST